MPVCECNHVGIRVKAFDCLYTRAENKAREHQPGQCIGTIGLKLYNRGGKKLWLCSCCNLVSDKLLQSNPPTKS